MKLGVLLFVFLSRTYSRRQHSLQSRKEVKIIAIKSLLFHLLREVESSAVLNLTKAHKIDIKA